MKIIKNNYKNNENIESRLMPIITYCDNCGSKLEITEEDTHIGYWGDRFVTCPCCGKESMVDEIEGIDLTADNINFPVHFYRTNKDTGAVEISNRGVKEDIKKGIEYFKTDKDAWCWYTCHGDLFVVIFKYNEDDEYFVVVTKDFYETYIPFTDEDRNSKENNYV